MGLELTTTKKRLFLCLWGLLLAAAAMTWWRSGIRLEQVPIFLHQTLEQVGLLRASLVYVVFYALRPLIFFPATLLTMSSGLLFGPWLGILLTIVGENASANFAFFLARHLGRDWIARHEGTRLKDWEQRLRRRGFETVLVMRLIYLPFDLVNYGCGLTAMSQRDFFYGTFIGILPGLAGFVLLGGSIHAGESHPMGIFALSLLSLGLGLLLARWLRDRRNEPDNS
ncbi:MAG: hypothetical protein Kow00100_08510 [Geothermobacteraceae bacterium]